MRAGVDYLIVKVGSDKMNVFLGKKAYVDVAPLKGIPYLHLLGSATLSVIPFAVA